MAGGGLRLDLPLCKRRGRPIKGARHLKQTGSAGGVPTTLVAANRSPVHPNRKSVGSTGAPFMNVMISSWASRPEWIVHWLVAPIWVNVAPCTGRAEADETQRVAGAGTVAHEVEDRVAVGLPGIEHERVVAGVTHEQVGTRSAIERVVAGVAVEGIAQARCRCRSGRRFPAAPTFPHSPSACSRSWKIPHRCPR